MNLLGSAPGSLPRSWESITKTWASRMAANSGLYTVGNAILKAARALKVKILEEAAIQLEVSPSEMDIVDGMLWVKGEDQARLGLGQLACRGLYDVHVANRSVVMHSYFPDANPNSVGAAFADVAVDTQTGVIKLENLVFGHDIGRAVNPMTVKRRSESGVNMGMG